MTQKLLLAASLTLVLTAAQSSEATLPSITASAWETLNQGLVAGDPEHRKQAIAALGTLGDVPEAVSPIEKALQDKDTLVRQAAAATLGDMGAKDAIPYLKNALDDNAEVSFTAAKALWDLGDTHDSVPKLMPLLSDDHLVRFMAAASIVKLSRQ